MKSGYEGGGLIALITHIRSDSLDSIRLIHSYKPTDSNKNPMNLFSIL